LVKTINSDFNLADFKTGLAIGTAYEENTKTAFAVCAIFDRDGKIISRIASTQVEVDFPYVPGLLAFRMGPVICKAIELFSDKVDLFLFDGQGIAHPSGFGLASHIGVLFNKPSIGVTKKSLFGNYTTPPRGAYYTELKHPRSKKTIGYCISSENNREPFFMSPGHQISLEDSMEVIKMIATDYALPYPVRVVHSQANRTARVYWDKLRVLQ
jgi:deoxyribonuclease V